MNPHAVREGAGTGARRLRVGVLILALISGSSFFASAVAQGLNWVNIARQSPISQFTDEDVDLFVETGTSALEEGRDGEQKAWVNPATGNSGSITAARSFERDGLHCREVVIENRSRSFYAKSTHNFCRKEEETWRWVPPER